MAKFKPFTLGRYEIVGELGRGAMGVVYKGHDTIIDRPVAVKTISGADPGSPLSSEETIGVFFKEAKIAGKLSHPNITAIYDIGKDRDANFFVMEYVEGDTMENRIERRAPLPLTEKLRIIATTARTLHYAHMRGVVHRDIKPSNIMILSNNEPKIMDFGVAKLKSGEWMTNIEEGRIFGTPHYMSPEQVKGEELDHRTDIFSLGVMAYEFLVNQKPFDGKTLKDVLRAVVTAEPAPLGFYDPRLPGELNEIVFHALEKNRDTRFSFTSQLADALELLIEKITNADGGRYRGLITQEKKNIARSLKRNYLFFSDFEEREIVEIFKLSSRERFEPGHMIFEEGTLGNKMFVIIEGAVKIATRDEKGGEVVISVLGEGDCFGEMAIIDNSSRSASAIAVSPTVVVAISEIALRVTNPQLCIKLYKNLAGIIAEKLRKTDRRLREKPDWGRR